MKKSTRPLKRYIGRGMLLGAFALIVYIFLFGDYGAYRIWKQKREITHLERTIHALYLKQEDLKREVELLQNDLEYIEKIAREDYGMIKEGELLYKIVTAGRGDGSEQEEGSDEPSSKEKRPGNP
jgi:cell division protein FtsB